MAKATSMNDTRTSTTVHTKPFQKTSSKKKLGVPKKFEKNFKKYLGLPKKSENEKIHKKFWGYKKKSGGTKRIWEWKKLEKKYEKNLKKNLGVPKKSENERNSKKNVGVQKKNLGVPKKSENEKNPKKIWGHKFLCKVQKNSLYNTQKSANLKCFKYCTQEYCGQENVPNIVHKNIVDKNIVLIFGEVWKFWVYTQM